MTVDLWMLLASVGLTFALILVASTPGILVDPIAALGNRDKAIDTGPWAARAKRTAENMKENLPLFAALVLIAHVSGQADATSALGAQIFVGARLVHAVLYLAGVSVLRTLSWVVSLIGMGMIVAAIF